ncbi:MAG: ABC transporter substrate-binding protein [Acholeplasmataceae bacterium]|nr:ABC transporter substrate-binding protein [Acholeplasmataceae bacterium]
MKKKYFFAICVLILMAFAAGCGGGKSGQDKTIILSDAGWDSIKFHNSVVSFIADKGYGLKTTVVTGSTPITHTALLRGDIDVNLETWSDNILTYRDDLKSGAIVELGTNFDDNRQGLYVPRYVIEGDAKRGIKAVAPDLKTVADLKRYSHIFVDEENPSKGRIYGAIPGWAIDEVLFKKFNYYKLNENFNYFRPGSEATMNASFVTAYEKGMPIVGYNWEPTWISGKLDLVLLEDAPYTVEGFKEGKTAARSVPVVIAANKKLLQKAPEFVEFLKKYRTSSALTAEALAYIADNKASYDDAAIHFLKKHDELLDKWLPAEKAKAVRAGITK